MASVNNSLSPLTSGETVRDYKHASRTFVDNNFELQPRHGHLFHVVFEFTAEAATLFNTIDQLEIPILVKSVDLPTYSIDVQTHNQYNRKVQSHHAISYNPVTIRFHDDVKESIRNLWHKYYIFYNADPTYSLDSNAYTPYDKYSNRVQQQWGLQRGNKRFFKNIKIYSMHNHKFAEYTLVNPMITAFNHDSHAYANSSPMEHIMQLAYETVKYATGFVNDVTPRGFADIHYDVEVSDLTEGNPQSTAFIGGQTRSVAGQVPTDLFNGNVIGVIKDAEIIYNEERLNTGNVLTDTLSIFTNNLLTGKKLTSNILVPVTGVVEKVGGKYLGNLLGVNEQGDTTGTGITNLISSGGQSIGRNFSAPNDSTQDDIGNAKKVPNKNGTVSYPNNISDAVVSISKYFGSKF
tara:strand:- start:33778 stop:34995 length:1218 start_codon:yes stop_codon:yes gene_type:complete